MSNSNPPKSDLEKRLRSIVEAIELNTRNDNSNTFAVEEIKAAIKDAGYINPEQVKKVQELVNQMANLANDAFRMPTIQYVKPNRAVTKAENLMTGAEWYQRFIDELDNEFHLMTKPVNIDSSVYYDAPNVMKAAKRAAGLQDET